ncbi:MAG TPA: alanine racemase [Candidatus Angelobacter sp.]|nr:alanine racemase [Candidatus Angelobacter sp.]
MTDHRLSTPRISGLEGALTPALVIDLDRLEQNIQTTLRLLGSQPNRWRPHIKTAKLALTLECLLRAGVAQFKCATTLELLTACECGAADVLVAYPCVGPRATRVKEIGQAYPKTAISVLVENETQGDEWRGGNISVFVDVNPGMDRTGIGQADVEAVTRLVTRIEETGVAFRGLHYYDGHHRNADLHERQELAYAGYRQLLRLVSSIERSGIHCAEVITSGTPGLPSAMTFPDFQRGKFVHRISAGTIVYNDVTSLAQLPAEWNYAIAAYVASMVVSQPKPDVVTCDAGHKTVSGDAGYPNCVVLGRPDLEPLHPSEEHLPLHVTDASRTPHIGDILLLAPKHVCPTVNNFDAALLVRNGKVAGTAVVTARGREHPFPAPTTTARTAGQPA